MLGGVNTMIRVNIDTNYYYLSPNKPAITKKEVIDLGLNINQRVIAVQDEDEWTGVVKHDPSLPEQWQWYVQLEIGRKFN